MADGLDANRSIGITHFTFGAGSGAAFDGRPRPLSRTAFLCGIALTDLGFILAVATIADRDRAPTLFVLAATVLALHTAGAYRFRVALDARRSIPRALLAWMAVCGLTVGAESALLGAAAVWAALGATGLAFLRASAAAIGRRLANRGTLGANYIILGNPAEAERCVKAARSDPGGACTQSVGMDPDAVARALHGVRIDAAVVALAPCDAALLPSLLAPLRRLPVRVLVELDRLAPARPGAGYEVEIKGLTLVQLAGRPIDGWAWAAKEAADFFLAAIALFVAAIPMLVIAAGIKLSSPGPVLFRQARQGYGGREFTILKFRTMAVAPCPQPGELAELMLANRNDPRAFPFGAFLRRWSLDELPQLLNVLRGDMWLVGPRPHSPLARAGGLTYAEAVEDYLARHRVKPGITGWAQVNGWRGPTDTVEQLTRRVEHDLQYIENWSPLLDLRILAATILGGFRGENAF